MLYSSFFFKRSSLAMKVIKPASCGIQFNSYCHALTLPRVMTKRKTFDCSGPVIFCNILVFPKKLFLFCKNKCKILAKNLNVDSLKRIASGSEMKLIKFVFYFSIYERDRSGGFSLKCRNVLRAAPRNLKILIFPIFARKFSKASKWRCF
jgi:hypothetical protein